MEEKTDIALDLDALASPNVQITYKGTVLSVTSPSLAQYAQLTDISSQLQAVAEAKDMAKLAELYAQMESLIKQLIPGLADSQLNFSQLTALFQLVAQLGAPTDKAAQKLRELGVEATGEDGPKA